MAPEPGGARRRSERPDPPVLADSHVHLDRYPSAVVTAMLARARRAGARYFLVVGVDQASSAAALGLARRRRGVLAAVGAHPGRIGRLDLGATVAWLRQVVEQPGVAAIGEVGLDDELPGLERQAAFFAACLDLAAERGLPLALHVVGAHARAQKLLVRRPGLHAVVHYFQGDVALAEAYLALGCHVSVGKPATRPERTTLRQAIQRIPLDRLLLETDTYPLPGRTTEPRDVAAICQAVADLQGVPYETVAAATTGNFWGLFGRGVR